MWKYDCLDKKSRLGGQLNFKDKCAFCGKLIPDLNCIVKLINVSRIFVNGTMYQEYSYSCPYINPLSLNDAITRYISAAALPQ